MHYESEETPVGHMSNVLKVISVGTRGKVGHLSGLGYSCEIHVNRLENSSERGKVATNRPQIYV